MATAILENVNPYSKYGLKRRPTYNEIIGLINENETITGQLPDRRATQFKASPEGSFFDGLDHLEILKEQQNRILERQMRELLLKQNLGGSTYSVSRLNQQNQQMQTPDPETQSDSNIGEATMQSQLQERARQAVERQQQTAEGHRGFLSGRTTPVLDRIFSGLNSRDNSSLGQPSPQRPPPNFIIGSASESESEAMQTARGEAREAFQQGTPPIQEATRTISYSTNVSRMNANDLKFQLFLRGFDVDDPENSLETSQRGRQGGLSTKKFYEEIARKMIQDGRWATRIEEELLKKRISDYNKKTARGSRD